MQERDDTTPVVPIEEHCPPGRGQMSLSERLFDPYAPPDPEEEAEKE